MFYPLAMLVCAPLIASIAGKSWDWVWGDEPRSILPTSVDRGLTLVQALLCTAFVVKPTSVVLYLIAMLYALMGIAVLTLRIRRGPADCGCWGRSRSGRLGFGLAFADLGFAAMACAATFADQNAPPLTIRLYLVSTMAIVAFFAMVTVPIYRPLLEEYRERADRYRPWAMGFPDLQPTSQPNDT
ncbi:hypothetical protein [Actinomadura sp. HBU206391]|uniref:hypothetical protein n=1 Tax=Actinomadura sp. HBU206391 TaxID=2731692 RepID=UPI001650113F|nr:hypothetical protein [Actinomadura sp. HBU206391]MBC6458635.1 hypothetical protein [Actinomadura sp. HBU206391]